MTASASASVIVPVLNEAASIRDLIAALLAQSTPPDEIVLADGGSSDGTVAIIEAIRAEHPQVRLVAGGGGRGENRNAAIAAAAHDVVACTDAGCLPESSWLQALLAPFGRGADWVAGFYRPQGETEVSTAAGVLMTMVREEVDPDSYIPSGASQAFRKQVWKAAGGFPEGVAAAEDTLFGERARAAGYRPEFVPEAVVRWQPPPGLGAMVAKAFVWGRADGRERLRGSSYKRLICVYWGSVAAAGLGATVSGWLGAAALVPLGVVTARRTRYKYRWVDGPARLLIPIGHVVQVLSQSAGYAVGRWEAR